MNINQKLIHPEENEHIAKSLFRARYIHYQHALLLTRINHKVWLVWHGRKTDFLGQCHPKAIFASYNRVSSLDIHSEIRVDFIRRIFHETGPTRKFRKLNTIFNLVRSQHSSLKLKFVTQPIRNYFVSRNETTFLSSIIFINRTPVFLSILQYDETTRVYT